MKHLLALFSVVALLLTAALVQAAGNDVPHFAPGDLFSGVFSDTSITVSLSVDATLPDNYYNGTITKGDNKYRLRAHVKDGAMSGTFSDDAQHEFPFTAVIAQGSLQFTTGGQTFALNPPAPAVPNPLVNPVTVPNPAGETGAKEIAPPKRSPILGKWAIAGDLGENKYTLTFKGNGELLVEDTSGSSISGPTFAYSNDTITFDGSSTINQLSLGGTWNVTWVDANTFKTTDSNGKALTFTRTK